MPIHAPFWEFLGQKWGKTETLCMFVPLGMQLTPETRHLRYNLSKSVQRFVP